MSDAGKNPGLSRVIAVLACGVALDAMAGRPLTTEDASTLEAGACQVEAWVDRSRVSTDSWLIPACNLGGVELQAGGARSRSDGISGTSHLIAQAKVAFRSVDDQPWGVGLVLGAVRHPQRESKRGWGDPYATVPVSFRLGEESLVHVNAGWSRNRSEKRDVTTWGVAFERSLSDRWTAVAEAFGENASRPFLRVGGRYALIPQRVDIDLTLVTRPGGSRDERLVSFGLYWN